MSLIQRLLASLPTMIQTGIDAAGAPTNGVGGMSDVMHSLSYANDLATKRRESAARIRSADQGNMLDWLNYQRLLKQQEEDNKYKQATLAQTGKNLEEDNKRGNFNTVAVMRNSGARPAADGIDPSRIITVGSTKLYYPTPEELAKEPMTADTYFKTATQAGVRARPINVLTPWLTGSRAPEPTPTPEPPADLAYPPTPEAQQQYFPSSDSKIRALSPLTSQLGTVPTLAKRLTPNAPTPGYDQIPGTERDGTYLERPNLETAADMKRADKLQISDLMIDGKKHKVVVDLDKGTTLDLGEADSGTGEMNRTAAERLWQFGVQAGKYPNTPEGRIQAQRDLQPLPQTQVAIPTAGGFNISTIRGGGFVPDGSVSPAQMGQNLAGASRDRLSSFSTILSEASKVQRMLSKANPNSFGPIVGRYTLADIQKFGGALEGLTPEQVELADAISNLLTSAAFGDGGKQLTGTELTRFEQVAPKLQDNLPTAIQHVKDTIEFFQERGKNDLKLMSPQQLSRLNSDVKTLFSVPTSIGGSGNGGGNGGDLSKMTDEELFRIAIGGGSGGKK